MKPMKYLLIAFLLAALLGGCSAGDLAGTPAASMPEADVPGQESTAFVAADYPYYGSFEAAMEASDATVRATAGKNMSMLEIGCGPDGFTNEYTVTGFTVVDVLKGDMKPGYTFELYQLGSSLGGMVYSSGSPLEFEVGAEYILCLFKPENGRHQLLTPQEGAYIDGDCGAGEGEYNFIPFTRTASYHIEPYFGEIEMEMIETEPRQSIQFEIVDIQGPFPIGEDGKLVVPDEDGRD